MPPYRAAAAATPGHPSLPGPAAARGKPAASTPHPNQGRFELGSPSVRLRSRARPVGLIGTLRPALRRRAVTRHRVHFAGKLHRATFAHPMGSRLKTAGDNRATPTTHHTRPLCHENPLSRPQPVYLQPVYYQSFDMQRSLERHLRTRYGPFTRLPCPVHGACRLRGDGQESSYLQTLEKPGSPAGSSRRTRSPSLQRGQPAFEPQQMSAAAPPELPPSQSLAAAASSSLARSSRPASE